MSEERLNELLRRIREELEDIEPPKNEHPLTYAHYKARTVYELCSEALVELESLIEKTKNRLERIRAELWARYGPGYITVKTVRNRQGKAYHYIVYRVLPDRKDIYLNNDEVVKLRNRLRELRALYRKLRKARTIAWAHIKATEDYA